MRDYFQSMGDPKAIPPAESLSPACMKTAKLHRCSPLHLTVGSLCALKSTSPCAVRVKLHTDYLEAQSGS